MNVPDESSSGLRTPKSSKGKVATKGSKKSPKKPIVDGTTDLKSPTTTDSSTKSPNKKKSKHKISTTDDKVQSLKSPKTPKTPKSSGSSKKKLSSRDEVPSSAPTSSTNKKSPGKGKSKRKGSTKHDNEEENEKQAWWNLEHLPFGDDNEQPPPPTSPNGLSFDEVRRRNEEVRKLKEKHVQEMQNSVQTGLVSRLLEQAKQKERETKPTVLHNVRARPLSIDVDTYEPPSYKRSNEQKTILKEATKNNFILKDFVNTGAKTDIKKLVKAFESVEVKEDEEFVTAGEDGDHFYVVESGEVEIQMDDQTITTAGKGSTFGERNLLYKAPWNVSVRATGKEPIKVLRLNHNTYRGIMQTTEEAKKPPPPPPKYVSKKKEEEDNAWLHNSKDVKETNAIKAALKNQSAEDLERIKILGEGQFGEVWLVATNLPGVAVPQGKTKHEFALKIQNVTEDEEPMIRGEISAMQELSHPFISTLYRTYEDEDTIDMLLGLIPGGEMWDVIHKENEETGEWLSGIPETHAQFYTMVVADTLSYMHNQQFVFRDLKPENIMLDAKGYPIIVDFGFAKKVTNKTYTFCGTPNYVSPEIVKNAGHNAAADWWAFGIVLYEMISGDNPFYYDGLEQMELFQCICEDDPEPLKEGFSASVVDLINKLLVKDTEKRLGSGRKRGKEVLNHSFYNGLSLQRLRAKQIRAPWIPGEDKETSSQQYSVALEKERYAAANEEDSEEEARRQAEEEMTEQKRRKEEEEQRKLEEQEKERCRREKEEKELLQQERERKAKEETDRKRRQQEEVERKARELEENLRRQREEEARREEERLQKEIERKAKEEAEQQRRRQEEEERKARELAENLRRQCEEEARLEEERLRQEKKEKKERARRKEELRKQKELEEELERQQAEELEKQREAERDRILQQHREEEERARAASASSEANQNSNGQGEADLSLDDVFRPQSSPTRNNPGKLDRSWNGFNASKGSGGKRGVPDINSVPDGIVGKLLNEHGKYETSSSPNKAAFNARYHEELNKSIGKGLVAERLAKAKANDKAGVPSMFSYF